MSVWAKARILKDSSEVNLRFLFGHTARLNSIKLKVNDDSLLIPYVESDDTLTLQLPDTLQLKNNFDVLFEYSLGIDSLPNGVVTLFRWYPFVFDNLALYELTARTTRDYMILSPGTSPTNDDNVGKKTYVMHVRRPISRMVLVIAKADAYTIFERRRQGTTVNFFLLNRDTSFTGDTSVSNRFMNESFCALDFCNHLVGPYSHEGLTLLEIPDMQGVISDPGFIMMGSTFLSIYRKNLYDWPPHEIAHQWFGSGAFSKHGDLKQWCIFEPMAEYISLMFNECNVSGSLERDIDKKMTEYRSEYLGTKDDLPLIQSGPSRVTYLKGTYLMHRLRKKMGEGDWKQFLQALYHNFEGNILTYEDFVRSLSGYCLECADMFARWVSAPGLPE
jgi:hypothetical protein